MITYKNVCLYNAIAQLYNDYIEYTESIWLSTTHTINIYVNWFYAKRLIL